MLLYQAIFILLRIFQTTGILKFLTSK
uniref:Uncharacterized protein n=1 Tax=Arundo donax TaxID=35708 RepID=A0A0A9BUP1_ARUDO